MPTPIITLPIHTIEQARALAGLLRAFIDGQAPDTNEGEDWKPDPDLAGMAALFAHLDAGIERAGKPAVCGGFLAYLGIAGVRVHSGGRYESRCQKCGAPDLNDGTPRTCTRPT